MNRSRALFLDRDGVINIDHGHVFQPDRFEFVDGIFDLVKLANRQGYLVFIVTNQAGIGRGYFTEKDFHGLMEWVCREFGARDGHIEKVYFCPDHPEHGIGIHKRDSEFRKPRPGMILAAADEFGVDLTASVSVGDKDSDIEAGMVAGIKCNILYRPGTDGRASDATRIVVKHLREIHPYLKS